MSWPQIFLLNKLAQKYLTTLWAIWKNIAFSIKPALATFGNKGGSRDLVVMGGDLQSEGRQFESKHLFLDGVFHIDLLSRFLDKDRK